MREVNHTFDVIWSRMGLGKTLMQTLTHPFCQAIASHYRMEDYISRVSKRSGYRLTLLMQKTKKDPAFEHGRTELRGLFHLNRQFIRTQTIIQLVATFFPILQGNGWTGVFGAIFRPKISGFDVWRVTSPPAKRAIAIQITITIIVIM